MDDSTDEGVVAYLLAGDPAVRWQTMQDLTDAPAAEVAAERARVAREGWGARLLAEQGEDGRWDGGTYRPGWADERRPFYDAWTATHFSLQQLADFGPGPDDPLVRAAIDRVRAHVRWEHEGEPYFDGEVEPCINGVALAIGAAFDQDASPIVATLLAGQLGDGGWNCWDDAEASSFHSTICVLEGLAAGEQRAPDPRIAEARRRGEEYLLERRLFRGRRSGEVVDLRFTMASYPVRWYYDVLRGLDHFRRVGRRDPRLAEAVDLLRSRRLPSGMWALENTHEGPTLFSFEAEGEGFPSRWVTLRALRVLRWWEAG